MKTPHSRSTMPLLPATLCSCRAHAARSAAHACRGELHGSTNALKS
jgi:hypothetical protein